MSEGTTTKIKRRKNIVPPVSKMPFITLPKMPETPELQSSLHPHFPSILMTQVPAPPSRKSTTQRKVSNYPNQFQHRFLNVHSDMNTSRNTSVKLNMNSDSNSSNHWESSKQNLRNKPILINKSIRKSNRVPPQRNNNSRNLQMKVQMNEKSMNSQPNSFTSFSKHSSSEKDMKSDGKSKSNDEVIDQDMKIQYMEDLMKSLMKIQTDSLFNSHYYVGIGTPSPPTKTRTSGPNASVSTNIPHQLPRHPFRNIRNRSPFKLTLGSSNVQNSNPNTDSIFNFPPQYPYTTVPISGNVNSDLITNAYDLSDTISVTEPYPNISDTTTDSHFTSIEDDLFTSTDSPLSNVNEPIVSMGMSFMKDLKSNNSVMRDFLLDSTSLLSSDEVELETHIERHQSIFPFHSRIPVDEPPPSTPSPHPSHPNLPRPHQNPQAQKLEKSFTSRLNSELPAGIRNSMLLEHRLHLRLYLLTVHNQAKLNFR